MPGRRDPDVRWPHCAAPSKWLETASSAIALFVGFAFLLPDFKARLECIVIFGGRDYR